MMISPVDVLNAPFPAGPHCLAIVCLPRVKASSPTLSAAPNHIFGRFFVSVRDREERSAMFSFASALPTRPVDTPWLADEMAIRPIEFLSLGARTAAHPIEAASLADAMAKHPIEAASLADAMAKHPTVAASMAGAMAK